MRLSAALLVAASCSLASGAPALRKSVFRPNNVKGDSVAFVQKKDHLPSDRKLKHSMDHDLKVSEIREEVKNDFTPHKAKGHDDHPKGGTRIDGIRDEVLHDFAPRQVPDELAEVDGAVHTTTYNKEEFNPFMNEEEAVYKQHMHEMQTIQAEYRDKKSKDKNKSSKEKNKSGKQTKHPEIMPLMNLGSDIPSSLPTLTPAPSLSDFPTNGDTEFGTLEPTIILKKLNLKAPVSSKSKGNKNKGKDAPKKTLVLVPAPLPTIEPSMRPMNETDNFFFDFTTVSPTVDVSTTVSNGTFTEDDEEMMMVINKDNKKYTEKYTDKSATSKSRQKKVKGASGKTKDSYDTMKKQTQKDHASEIMPLKLPSMMPTHVGDLIAKGEKTNKYKDDKSALPSSYKSSKVKGAKGGSVEKKVPVNEPSTNKKKFFAPTPIGNLFHSSQETQTNTTQEVEEIATVAPTGKPTKEPKSNKSTSVPKKSKGTVFDDESSMIEPRDAVPKKLIKNTGGDQPNLLENVATTNVAVESKSASNTSPPASSYESHTSTVTPPVVAFQYITSSTQAPRDTDYTELAQVTVDALDAMLYSSFEYDDSVDYYFTEVDEFLLLDSRLIKYVIEAYFRNPGRVPEESELETIALQGFAKDGKFYKDYMGRLQNMKSPVFSTTREIHFLSSEEDLSLVAAGADIVDSASEKNMGKILGPAISGVVAILLGFCAVRYCTSNDEYEEDGEGKLRRVTNDGDTSTYVSDYKTTAFSDDYNTLATTSNDRGNSYDNQDNLQRELEDVTRELRDFEDVSLQEEEEARFVGDKSDPAGWSATVSTASDEHSLPESHDFETHSVDDVNIRSFDEHDSRIKMDSLNSSDTAKMAHEPVKVSTKVLGTASSVAAAAAAVAKAAVAGVSSTSELSSNESTPKATPAKLPNKLPVQVKDKAVSGPAVEPVKPAAPKQFKWTVADPKAGNVAKPAPPTPRVWPPLKSTTEAKGIPRDISTTSSSSQPDGKPEWMTVKLRPSGSALTEKDSTPAVLDQTPKGFVAELTKRLQEKK